MLTRLRRQKRYGPPDQGDLAKKMQDREFRRKVEQMSNEERMELAMQRQQSMTSTVKPESLAVMAALKECSDLIQAQSQAMWNHEHACNTKTKSTQLPGLGRAVGRGRGCACPPLRDS